MLRPVERRTKGWSTYLGRAAAYAITDRAPPQSDAPADIGGPPKSWACGCAATDATEPDPDAPNRSATKWTFNSPSDVGRRRPALIRRNHGRRSGLVGRGAQPVEQGGVRRALAKDAPVRRSVVAMLRLLATVVGLLVSSDA